MSAQDTVRIKIWSATNLAHNYDCPVILVTRIEMYFQVINVLGCTDYNAADKPQRVIIYDGRIIALHTLLSINATADGH